MRDLLVITPTRGRPGRLKDMMDACLSLSRAAIDIAPAYDDDDPEREAYEVLRERDAAGSNPWYSGPRDSVSGWTNKVAMENVGRYRALCSMSDDHLPRTPGWDRLLLEAIDAMGGTGIAYGDDLIQGALCPTAAVVSSDIVAALGWMALPEARHFVIDNAWQALGEQAGCLAYLPGVIIEHLHFSSGKGEHDATYRDAEADWFPDLAAADAWAAGRMKDDVATVAALVAGRKAGA